MENTAIVQQDFNLVEIVLQIKLPWRVHPPVPNVPRALSAKTMELVSIANRVNTVTAIANVWNARLDSSAQGAQITFNVPQENIKMNGVNFHASIALKDRINRTMERMDASAAPQVSERSKSYRICANSWRKMFNI